MALHTVDMLLPVQIGRPVADLGLETSGHLTIRNVLKNRRTQVSIKYYQSKLNLNIVYETYCKISFSGRIIKSFEIINVTLEYCM